MCFIINVVKCLRMFPNLRVTWVHKLPIGPKRETPNLKYTNFENPAGRANIPVLQLGQEYS